MSDTRIIKSDDPFARVQKTVMNNGSLSLAARGLYAILAANDGGPVPLAEILRNLCLNDAKAKSALSELADFNLVGGMQ